MTASPPKAPAGKIRRRAAAPGGGRAPKIEGTPDAAARPQRVFEKIYDHIREDVIDGRLRPGDKLPSEREFAERLGFSRSAVREALRALEASGILHLQPGVSGGAYVRNADDGGAVHRSLQDVVALGQIPLADVTFVRGILMARAVELACRHGTDDQFDRLAANIEGTRVAAEADDEAALLARHAEFFKLVGDCSGNEFLALLIEATTSIVLQLVAVLHVQMTQELLILREDILTNLRARDRSGAARAMAEMVAFQHGYVTGQARSIAAGTPSERQEAPAVAGTHAAAPAARKRRTS